MRYGNKTKTGDASLSSIGFTIKPSATDIFFSQVANKTITEVYGHLIYENFLFDAAKILDICAIFDRPDESMRQLLTDILQNVFKCQPK